MGWVNLCVGGGGGEGKMHPTLNNPSYRYGNQSKSDSLHLRGTTNYYVHY